MSWEPLTCCSMGAATDCATTSALAPGKVVDTVTWGGTTCGYWAIGRPRIESPPIRIMISAMTVEKTGRSMKKLNTVTFDDSIDSVCRRQDSRQGAHLALCLWRRGRCRNRRLGSWRRHDGFD